VNLSYLAGFADGEGYLGVQPRKRTRPNFVFAVVNTDIKPLKAFKKWFGGTINQLVEHRPRMEPRIVYRYSVQGALAAKAIARLEPHFITKKPQARVFLRAFHEITSRKRGDRRLEREKWFISKMSSLKKK
jgi:hypothetical protein